jgi:hypothetical protein
LSAVDVVFMDSCRCCSPDGLFSVSCYVLSLYELCC